MLFLLSLASGASMSRLQTRPGQAGISVDGSAEPPAPSPRWSGSGSGPARPAAGSGAATLHADVVDVMYTETATSPTTSLPRPTECVGAITGICTVTTAEDITDGLIFASGASSPSSGTSGPYSSGLDSGSGSGSGSGTTTNFCNSSTPRYYGSPTGLVSLRECLHRVRYDVCGERPHIHFDIQSMLASAVGGDGDRAVITIAKGIPAIGPSCLVIDGYSGRPAAWAPPVVIDGSLVSEGHDGVVIVNADGVVLRGLEFTRFPEYGVRIMHSAPDTVVEACWLRSNGVGGIIASGPRLQLGSVDGGAAARNVVSGNRIVGVRFEGYGQDGPVDSRVENILVGLEHVHVATADSAATTRVNANGHGIIVEHRNVKDDDAHPGTDGIRIGSRHSTAGTQVVVSGNAGVGIVLQGSNALVVAAYVGVDVDGVTAVGNSEAGIEIAGHSNTIGVPTFETVRSGPSVVVSGNGREGILSLGTSVTIVNTVVGLGADVATKAANAWDGILVASGSVTIGGPIGGDTPGGASAESTRVVVSGNTLSGIRVGPAADAATFASYGCSFTMPPALTEQMWWGDEQAAPTVSILSAHIGLTAPNGNDGITVQMENGNVTVGRPTAADATAAAVANVPSVVISGNGRNGITVIGAARTVVQHTTVGLSAVGDTAVGNGRHGVVFGESAGNSSNIGAGTIIGGNKWSAVGDFRSTANLAGGSGGFGFDSVSGWSDAGVANDWDTGRLKVVNAITITNGGGASAANEPANVDATTMGADAYRDSVFMYELEKTYVLPKPNDDFEFANAVGSIRYGVKCEESDSLAPVECPGKFYVTAASGEVVFTPTVATTAPLVAKLVVQDDGRECTGTSLSTATAIQWNIAVFPDDTVSVTNGPGRSGCLNGGSAVDTVKFDRAFDCDCATTPGSGTNCQHLAPKGSALVVGASVGSAVFIVIAVLIAAKYSRRYQAHRAMMRPVEFAQMFEKMVAAGEINRADDGKGKQMATAGNVGTAPVAGWREIPRKHLTLLDKVGSGQFGEVWKCVLDEEKSRGVPEHTVAAKTVLDPLKNLEAAAELLKEAAVMVQVAGHTNLVSIIGVVTSGHPYVLVLSYCEHGSLKGVLQQRAADGNALSMVAKLEMAGEVTTGMAHLASRRFIHRDLAARNVLLASGNTSTTGMVCKIADFGLSRGGATTGQDGVGIGFDTTYYRAQTGKFPVRWTAPEAMAIGGKYTTASDVWSFGVLLVEMLLDGETPYGDIKANKSVMEYTMNGGLHPRPAGCTDAMHGLLLECWAAKVADRPTFVQLGVATSDMALAEAKAVDRVQLLEFAVQSEKRHDRLINGPSLVGPGSLAAGQSDSPRSNVYSSGPYRKNQLVQNTVARREGVLLRDLDILEDRAKAAESSLTQYEPEYEKVAQTWCGTAWAKEMQVVADQVQRSCTAELAGAPLTLPNPWQHDGIQTTSKRYLQRLYGIYEGSNDPLATVMSACTRIVETWFDASEIQIEGGPLKKRDRVFEKVLLKRGDFAAIFDYARLSFVISNPARVPALLAKLHAAPEFAFVRIKNRLDPTVSAYESGGYRDCQCLVRLPSGWVVELQLIPAAIYAVRKRCGHGAYKEHRFVLEGRRVARQHTNNSVDGCQQPGPRTIMCGPEVATGSSPDQHLYAYATAVWANATGSTTEHTAVTIDC